MLDKFRGSMLGLAVGDALGTSAEFRKVGEFKPITTMRGGGVFNLEAGQWTDDTSMALCLAESLIMNNGVNLEHQMTLYKRWYEDGYNSPTGKCFDIGGQTLDAIEDFTDNGVIEYWNKDNTMINAILKV